MIEKVDKTVLKETKYIALLCLIFSLIMQAVFLVCGKWELEVLFGNLLGGFAAVINFFLMGLTVQAAVKKEKKQAVNTVKLSQTLRMAVLFIVAALGVLLPCFNVLASLLPLFFPRIAILLRPLFMRKNKKEETGDNIGKEE